MPAPEYVYLVLFPDEERFLFTRLISSQNHRAWGTKRPYLVYELPVGGENFMALFSILDKRIISPYFFSETTVSGESY